MKNYFKQFSPARLLVAFAILVLAGFGVEAIAKMHGLPVAAGCVTVLLVALIPKISPSMRENAIDSDLQLDVVLESAMEAFKEALTPLALFCIAFQDVALKGTNKMQVPYYPLETAASKDYDGSYKFDVGTDTQAKEVTINKRKYQSLAWTSEERRRQPKFDPETLGRIKGLKLAEDILTDIWSLFTVANYGAAAFTGGAADFDVDDVIDLEVVVETAKWPASGRGLLLKPAYVGGLKKDMNANGGMATFARDSNGNLTNFPGLHSFAFATSNVIPANAINLIGAAVYRSAMLVGFAPIEPDPAVMAQLNDYRIQSDDDIGISLEFREWGDADSDTAKRTIEVNYGYARGEAAAAKLLVSAG